MFCSTFFRTLLAVAGAVFMLVPAPADAQIVRRYPGGGVSVRAPFVRVDVGPNGATSVRAPFVAVDDPAGPYGRGRTYVGWGRRRMPRPGYAQADPYYYGQAQTMQPAFAGPRPLPTAEELATLDIVTLVETLRHLSAHFAYSLQRFDKAAGWQRYLALPGDALGSPGIEPVAIRLDVLEKQLARYDRVATSAEFAKIADLPSFAPTHAALRLVVERFSADGPVIPHDPSRRDPGPTTEGSTTEGSTTEGSKVEQDESELLPSPPPSPEPRRGERSILRRR